MALANQMVQVRTEAKASPTMTVLTTMSAAMNMPHGDRSRGNESMAPVAGSVGATGEADSGGWAGTVGAAVAGGNEILPHASEPWAPLRGRSYSSNTRFAEKKRLIRRQI